MKQKKVVSSSKKKSLSSKKKGSYSFVDFLKSYRFLYGMIAFLFIVVIVLGIMVMVKKKEYNENHANLVFPVMEKGVHNSMNLDLNELKKKGSYIIKVTDFRGDQINQEEIDYSLVLRNETGVSLEVLKGKDSTNLMVDQEATRIEGVQLKSKEKQEDIYTVRILDDSKLEKDEKISIEIES